MVGNCNNCCKGVTKSNTPCKNLGTYTEGDCRYCYWHVPRLNENCVICLSNLFDIVVLPCGHIFHKKCIKKWLSFSSNCPICREQVT